MHKSNAFDCDDADDDDVSHLLGATDIHRAWAAEWQESNSAWWQRPRTTRVPQQWLCFISLWRFSQEVCIVHSIVFASEI